MITLWTFGDSHAGKWAGWNSIKVEGLNIKTCSFTGTLMYSWAFSRNKKARFDSVKLKKDDYVCFCYGEIDMRAHIHKYKDEWQDNIDNLLDKYFERIFDETHKVTSNIIISNIVPHLYSEPPLKGVPREGTPEDVKKYTLYANEGLKKRAKEYDYIFMDLYDKHIDEDGFLIREMSDEICHIKDFTYLQGWLESFMENK